MGHCNNDVFMSQGISSQTRSLVWLLLTLSESGPSMTPLVLLDPRFQAPHLQDGEKGSGKTSLPAGPLLLVKFASSPNTLFFLIKQRLILGFSLALFSSHGAVTNHTQLFIRPSLY